MIIDILKDVYSSRSIEKSLVSGVGEVLCNLNDYSPYLKKEDKDISLYAIMDDGAFGPLNKIVVTSEEGIGKTTLTKSVLYRWGMGTLWNDKYDIVYRADLQLLLDISWMDYYKNYDLGDPKVILQCLIHYSISGGENQQEVDSLGFKSENIALPCDGKCLLILDGYDNIVKELDDYKKIDTIVSQCTNILVTADKPSIKIRDEKNYDGVIRHHGIGDTGIEQYKQASFAGVPSSSFDSLLHLNEYVRDLCRTPSNLFILCYLFKNEFLPEHPAESNIYYQYIRKLSSAYVQDNWHGFEDRGEALAASICSLFEYSSDKLVEGEIKGVLDKDDSSSSAFLQGGINHLTDNQNISADSGGILSLRKMHQYGLMVPKEGEKGANSVKLETELQKLKFVFNPDILQEYFTAVGVVRSLLGSDIEAKEKAIKFVSEQKFSPSYLEQIKYISGILGILDRDEDAYEFLIKIDLIKSKKHIERAMSSYWREVTTNLYENYENERSVQVAFTLMTLLGQIMPNQITDANLIHSAKLVDFIDILAIYDLINSFTPTSDISSIKWTEKLKATNYMSQKIKEFVLAGLEGDFQALYSKFNNLNVDNGLQACLTYYNKKLEEALKLLEEASQKDPKLKKNISRMMKVSCFQAVNNHWTRFTPRDISTALTEEFNKLAAGGEKLKWDVIKAAMSCKLKIGNSPAVPKEIDCALEVLKQFNLIDVDARFVDMISDSGVFKDKENSTKLSSTSMEYYLTPKRSTTYSDISLQYVLYFLNNVSTEGGFWDAVIDGLSKYYYDQNEYVRYIAVKNSVAITLRYNNKDYFEDITDRLHRLIGDTSIGIKILAIDSMFDILGASGSRDLVEDCLPKIMRAISDPSDFVKSAIIIGVAKLVKSVLDKVFLPDNAEQMNSPISGNDFAQDLIEENTAKILRLFPDQSDAVKSSIVTSVLSILKFSISKELDKGEQSSDSVSSLGYAQDLLDDNLAKILRLFPDQSDNVKTDIVENSSSLLSLISDKALVSNAVKNNTSNADNPLSHEAFSQDLIEDNIVKILSFFPDQTDAVKSSIVGCISSLLISVASKGFDRDTTKESIANQGNPLSSRNFSQDLIEDNIVKILCLFPDQSDIVKSSIVGSASSILISIANLIGSNNLPKDGVAKLENPLSDEGVAQDLIEDNIVKILRLFSDQSDIVKASIVESVASLLMSIVGRGFSQDLIEDNTIKLLGYLDSNKTRLSRVIIDSATQIGTCVLLSTPDKPSSNSEIDAVENEDKLDILDKILNEWVECLSIDDQDLRLSVIDSSTEIIVRSYIKTENLDVVGAYEKILETLYGNNAGIKFSSINGLVGISYALRKSDELTEKLLPQLVQGFSSQDMGVCLSSIDGACAIIGNTLLERSAIKKGTYLDDIAGYVTEKLLPEIIKCASNQNIPISLIKRGMVKALCGSVDVAKDSMDVMQEHYTNKTDSRVAVAMIEISAEVVLRFLQLDLAKDLMDALQDSFSSKVPDIRNVSIQSAVMVAINLDDLDLDKNLLSALADCFDNSDDDVVITAIHAAYKLVESTERKELADILLSNLKGCFDSDSANVKKAALDAAVKLVINSGDKEAAKGLIMSLQADMDDSPDLIISTLFLTSELVIKIKDKELAKSMLDSWTMYFNSDDARVKKAATESAIKLIISFNDTESAKNLLMSLQSGIDDSPSVVASALSLTGGLVVQLKDKGLARSLLGSWAMYFNDDSPVIQTKVKQEADKIVKSFNNDPMLKGMIPMVMPSMPTIPDIPDIDI
jgi:hypothetical protein